MRSEQSGQTRRIAWLLLCLAVLGMATRLLPLPDPLAVQLDHALLPLGSHGHVLGTDELGRDVLSRTLIGLGTTLWVSVAALVSALAAGIVVGAAAGFAPGSILDRILNWLINLILSLPFLLIVAAVLSLTTPGLVKAYAVLAGVMWVHPARIVRGEVQRRRALGYIKAARALGVSESRILWHKLVRRAVPPAVVFAYTYLPEFVALEAGISFLGLGVQPPEPGLGKMIFDGLPYLYSAWWLSLSPAGMLFVIVLMINLTVRMGRRRDVG